MSYLEDAAALVDAGYRIIPVHPDRKIPAVSGWASPDYEGLGVDELGYWFGMDEVTRSPICHGVGILTGLTASTHKNLLVIDVDSWAAWKQVCALHGWDYDRPPGAYGAVKTPSGGRHFYFNLDASQKVTNANTFPEGVDTRGDGGFVVAPPTKGYEWTPLS